MQILMIDPWGTNGLDLYINGLCEGLANGHRVTLATNAHYPLKNPDSYVVLPFFFKRSEKMPRGRIRAMVRFFEYCLGYSRVARLVRSTRFEVIHIQWLLSDVVDRRMVPWLRRRCGKLVLTAHNAIPHRDGSRHIPSLQQTYSGFDAIVVHGLAVRDELLQHFKLDASRIHLQRHGDKKSMERDIPVAGAGELPADLAASISGFEKVFLCAGNMFFNKGVDRLIRLWLEINPIRHVLVVVGKKDADYRELTALEPAIHAAPNIVFHGEFLPEPVLNQLFRTCDCVLLTYRHASMSGVVFSAAQFKKTFLCTNVGAFSDYLIPGETALMCENSDESIAQALRTLFDSCGKQTLAEMGLKNHAFISSEFAWDRIATRLADECYTALPRRPC